MAVWTIEPKEGVTDLGNGSFRFDGNESANPSSYTITYTDDNGATGSTTFVIPPCDPCYFIVNTDAVTVFFINPQNNKTVKEVNLQDGQTETSFTSEDNRALRLTEIKVRGVRSGYEYEESAIHCNGTIEFYGKKIEYDITADPQKLECGETSVRFTATRKNN